MIRLRESSLHRNGKRSRLASEAVAFLGRDVRLADGLRQTLQADGWDLDWSQDEDGQWCATISCPAIPHAVVGRGGSRIAAISRANVAAIRLLAGSNFHHEIHRGN